jgi:lytic murein transglycosylase
MRLTLAAATLALALALPASAQQCGGSFTAFVQGLQAEAVAAGIPGDTVASFFRGVEQDQRVLSRDRQQGFFTRPFIDFSRNLISQGRLDRARQLLRQQQALFDRAQRDYGVPPGILLSFLAFETDFGAFQGDFNTRNALVTLAHDCRRPQLFRPQVIAMAELYRRGLLDPRTTVGAWAGEIGMLQMLPTDILTLGVDGDGDGRVDPRISMPDAVLSGAALLRHHGWRPGQPWLHEVRVPAQFEWSLTGLRSELPVSAWAAMGVAPRHGALPAGDLPASLILPQGAGGPAFLIFPNFRVLFDWNQSFTYVLTAAYFATRIEGAPVFDPGSPREGLSREQMQELQRLLTARGYDTGGATGILGANTRIAVQDFQASIGVPADGWPTPDLLRRAR